MKEKFHGFCIKRGCKIGCLSLASTSYLDKAADIRYLIFLEKSTFSFFVESFWNVVRFGFEVLSFLFIFNVSSFFRNFLLSVNWKERLLFKLGVNPMISKLRTNRRKSSPNKTEALIKVNPKNTPRTRSRNTQNATRNKKN